MKRIYLIEDDEVYAEFVKKSLEKDKKYVVQSFTSAENCLKMLESDINPNVMIIDYFLPGMNGLELYNKLKKQKNKALVIVMSSNNDGNLVIELMKKGIRNYVMKDENVMDSINAILEENDDKLIELYS